MNESKQTDWKKVDEIIRAYLGLRHQIVGIKIRGSDIREDESHLKPEKPMAYCHMVRIASLQGRTFLYDEADEACPTAEIILGFRAPRYAEIEPRVKPSDTKSVLIAPIAQMKEKPDVALATLTPKQMMDLTTVLQAEKQRLLSVGFRGEAACAEFTAKPYMEHKPNISLLCNGARVIHSDFRDNELIFGAPPEIYARATEIMERITKIGGTLCGCRVSDIPTEIISEFKRIGLSRSTDYFFGRVSGNNIRVYLNKDFQGRLTLITIHLPIKTPSDKKAGEAAKRLKQLLLSPYRVSQRDYWLDLTMTSSADELGIDLLNGDSIEIAVKGFVSKMTQHLSKVGIE